ncbi:MAG: metallophosphoesterase [Candidatus Eisenbacteria bacterium]
MHNRPNTVFFAFWAGVALMLVIAGPAGAIPLGDTLTVIQRPLLNIPSIVTEGNTLTIECEASPATSGWAAELQRDGIQISMTVFSSTYDPSTLWWEVEALVPTVPVYDLYDLAVTASGGVDDTTWSAVRVIPAFKEDYYFVHITDPHMPTHLYYYEDGADTDSSEVVDMREIIHDVNIINPEFVLLTGDFINEGELEDYLNKRYFSRTQRLLTEFDVPVYLTSGNHDIGGWDDTPPPDGTARQTWWRFFGWKRCDSPPPGAPWYTQNYSFDYGPVHYIGLEAYNNYDNWRPGIYGSDSFTPGQMDWLDNEMTASSGSAAQVLFYHSDFSDQINLNSLGADMALWGHNHRDYDDFSHPYDIGTDNACDGARSYRLIRVSSGSLSPTSTVSAGSGGSNLEVAYSPANDGTNYTVTADITNDIDERFEHGQLRFVMPNEVGTVDVTGGALLQIDYSGLYAVYYVAVDILPTSSQTVTVTLTPGSSDPPTVTVTQPNGGEIWHIDSFFDITWTADDDVGVTSIDILLSSDGGATYPHTIATGETNDGTCSWQVDVSPTTQARVKVIAYDAATNSGEDVSNGNFTIADGEDPVVTVTQPNGGETWDIDSFFDITWSASDNIGVTSIDILLSSDGGATYPHTIATGETNDGTCSWQVDVSPTTQARVKVIAYDAATNSGEDVSNGNFTIADGEDPVVTVTQPNGGETWDIGQAYDITWTATDNIAVASITIVFSGDGGLTYPDTIATGETNDGLHTWNVGAGATLNARIKVIAYDDGGNSGDDACDADFEIYDPTAGTVPEPEIPSSLVITGTSPNPFSEHAVIRFGLPRDGTVRIDVYDVSGRLAVSLVREDYPAGYHEVDWQNDGKVGTGLYFLRLRLGPDTMTRKVVVSR